jgi:protein-S-isoprenylcysteine O-methyltransferase Ste14
LKNVNNKAFLGLLQLLVLLGAPLFLVARTLFYWQAWLFIALYWTSTLGMTVYQMVYCPDLLKRRVRGRLGAETDNSQKIIQPLGLAAAFLVLVVSAMDHRRGWSVVTARMALTGDAVVVLGLLVIFLTFRENRFASALIGVDAGQRVIDTGPYAIVRHPMYSGELVLVLGAPVALGSLWGLVMILPITALTAWRLVEEEKFLARNLVGYSQYLTKVRYRLVPLVW